MLKHFAGKLCETESRGLKTLPAWQKVGAAPKSSAFEESQSADATELHHPRQVQAQKHFVCGSCWKIHFIPFLVCWFADAEAYHKMGVVFDNVGMYDEVRYFRHVLKEKDQPNDGAILSHGTNT